MTNSKLKTSKNSPEKNLNNRNFSEEHSKVILQTKNIYLNNNILVNNNKETNLNANSHLKPSINFNNINGSENIDCLGEIDYLKNKLMKKKENAKTNSNFLNYTNPHQIMNCSSQPKYNGFNDLSKIYPLYRK